MITNTQAKKTQIVKKKSLQSVHNYTIFIKKKNISRIKLYIVPFFIKFGLYELWCIYVLSEEILTRKIFILFLKVFFLMNEIKGKKAQLYRLFESVTKLKKIEKMILNYLSENIDFVFYTKTVSSFCTFFEYIRFNFFDRKPLF